MKQLFTRILYTYGIFSLVFALFLLWQRNTPNRLTFASMPQQHIVAKYVSPPVSILIPSIHLDLPLFPAAIQNGNWSISTGGIAYLVSSPIPGSPGNSIVYGHNWDSLFGHLSQIMPGAIIGITYSDHSLKRFTVTYTTVVSPSDVSILAPSSDARITLYTCTGFLDSKRFVVSALLTQ